ncbi:unnamed protein product [Pleuronectes platessa]|uniref:Uncharacterized protein n=1 Tax=Pleuronectes platessa TaxID=8262 RepID=A0A9N7TKV1_PLEPL|nr:unnamed protein product [Pleuronectes platessa]
MASRRIRYQVLLSDLLGPRANGQKLRRAQDPGVGGGSVKLADSSSKASYITQNGDKDTSCARLPAISASSISERQCCLQLLLSPSLPIREPAGCRTQAQPACGDIAACRRGIVRAQTQSTGVQGITLYLREEQVANCRIRLKTERARVGGAVTERLLPDVSPIELRCMSDEWRSTARSSAERGQG